MFASLLSFGLQEEEKEAEERKKQELAKKPKLRGRECPGAEHIVARMEVEREASYAYTFPCPENGYQVMRRPQSRAKIAGVKLPKIRGEDQTTPLPPQTVEEQKCPGAAHIRKKMEMEKKAINALKTPCPQNNYSVYIDGNAMQAKLRAKEKLLAKQMKEKTSSGPRPALRSKPEVVFSAQIEKSVLEKSLAEMETAVKKLEVESNKSGEEEEEDDLDFGMISSYGGVRRSKASGTTGTAPHVAGSGRVAAKRVAVRGAAASAESDNEGSNMDEDFGMISSYGGVRRSKASGTSSPRTSKSAGGRSKKNTTRRVDMPPESDEDIDFGMISSYGGVRRSKASGTSSPRTSKPAGGKTTKKNTAKRVDMPPESDEEIDFGMISSYGGVRRSKATSGRTSSPTSSAGPPQSKKNTASRRVDVPPESDEEIDFGMISSYGGVRRSKATGVQHAKSPSSTSGAVQETPKQEEEDLEDFGMISSYGGVRRSKATASPTHQRQASPVHAVSTSTTTAAATEQAPAASEDEDEIDAGMISSYGGVRRSKATAPGTKTGASTKVRETTIVPAAQQAPLESDEEDIDFGMISSYGGVRRSKASAVGTSPTTGAAEGGTAVGAEDGSTAGESKVAEHVVPAPVSDDDEGDDLDAGMISSYGGVRRSKTTEQPVLQKSTAPPTVVSAEDKEAGGQPAEQVAAQNEANVETTQQEVPVEEDEEDLDAGMISSYAGVKRSKAGATA